MPEYTKEQIAADLAIISAYIEDGSPLPESEDDPYWKASAAGERLHGVLSALSTAEQERDESKSKAEQYYDDWYVSKAEFGNITAKLRDRVRTAEARCAELEARLQGAAERGVEWQEKLCKADEWSCKDCAECAELRASILGEKKE